MIVNEIGTRSLTRFGNYPREKDLCVNVEKTRLKQNRAESKRNEKVVEEVNEFCYYKL